MKRLWYGIQAAGIFLFAFWMLVIIASYTLDGHSYELRNGWTVTIQDHTYKFTKRHK